MATTLGKRLILELNRPCPGAFEQADRPSNVKRVAVSSVGVNDKVGTNTIKLRFTKSGTKALKKLSKKRTRSVVLTSTVTDASGNASTIAKKAKIKP